MLKKESVKTTEITTPILETKTLFKSGTSIRISHGDALYILRITKTNKLILTK
ncbi:MAG: hemin uptake protein HemP [Epsilonproteobacteria bacterium]|nr:hemin uptake protein HemP [Campylobacterota bacterium]